MKQGEFLMLKPAELFQSGMVLQREKPLTVWGTADAGAVVNVSVQGRTGSARAGDDGTWRAAVAPLHASECETMQISDGTQTVTLTDVAVGEVWIAGGQSNMEFHMRYERHLDDAKPRCANPRVRFFDVPEVAYDGQREQFDYSGMARWRTASPADIDYFSAVGYYFEAALERALDVPVGIVGCNWGGTVCAAWMNPDTVREAGPEWMESYEAFAASADLPAYFAKQKDNPMNGRGTPFSNPFSEFVMPKTRTEEELAAFFRSLDLPPYERGSEPLVQNLPGALFEHMVKTAAPFPVRGVLWYQGESDDEPGRQKRYAAMLSGMIGDWRALWHDELPFLIVQLPGFEHWLQVTCMDYDTIRQAQETVTRTVPGTWLCSVSDAGEQHDIHPKDKKVVGERLALLAQQHVYGLPVCGDAPAAVSAQAENGAVVVRFEHAAGGLVCTGETVAALRLRRDGRDVPLRSAIRGDALVVEPLEALTGAVTVTFAHGSWYRVNLYNRAGIPAIPFTFSLNL